MYEDGCQAHMPTWALEFRLNEQCCYDSAGVPVCCDPSDTTTTSTTSTRTTPAGDPDESLTTTSSMPTGACCFDDGICMDDVHFTDCQDDESFFPGQECCLDDVFGIEKVCCVHASGACCYDNGCIDVPSSEDCTEGVEDGVFQGVGTICDGLDCWAA